MAGRRFLPATAAACRAQLAAPAMQFGDDDRTLAWAYRTSVLREVVMYAAYQAYAHTARGNDPAEARLRTTDKNARARAADLGLDLTLGPSDCARLDTGTRPPGRIRPAPCATSSRT
ncbi:MULTISPECIES: hypothetical protein [Streptomyces]|uniref:Uncharacterized protein n=2 Tax=Streptomyces TaxID=1883 RepID=A0ABV9JCK0_9ACTN